MERLDMTMLKNLYNANVEINIYCGNSRNPCVSCEECNPSKRIAEMEMTASKAENT